MRRGFAGLWGDGKIASKIFGSSNEKAIKSVLPIVTKINDHENEVRKLTDQQLKDKTIVLLGFGLKDVKIETAQDLVRFIKNYTDNINRQGLLGKLMGTKILDARIISSKLVKRDDDTEIVQKKSLSANTPINW